MSAFDPKRTCAANFAAVRSTFALSTHLSYKSNVFRFGDHTVKKGFKRRAWTKAHVRTLKSLARKKTPAGRIARNLKRTESATWRKARRIGLSLRSRI